MQNSPARDSTLAALKARFGMESAGRTAAAAFDPLGAPEPALLHEVYAETGADAPAALGFALCRAAQAARGRPWLWAVEEAVGRETGRPSGAGLHEMGLCVEDALLVRARDMAALLAVGEEALRTPALGAVLLSAWGESKALTLTSSRRLALAAEAGGPAALLVRAGAAPAPSAAAVRWAVAAARSRPLPGGAPGLPAFRATLLRRRAGGGSKTWTLEWDREHRLFRHPAPLSGGLVPLPVDRPAAAHGEPAWRRTG